MRMRAHDDIRARLDRRAADGALLAGEIIPVFAAPVERRDHDLASRLAQRLHIRADVLLAALVGEAVAGHADLHAVLFKNAELAAAGDDDPRRLQIGDRVRLALLAVVERVVVGDVHRLHAAQRQNVGVFRRALEVVELLLLARLLRQRALKVHERQIVRREQGLQAGEKPAVALVRRDVFKAVLPLAQIVRRAERRIAAQRDGECLRPRVRALRGRLRVLRRGHVRKRNACAVRLRGLFLPHPFDFFVSDVRIAQRIIHLAKPCGRERRHQQESAPYGFFHRSAPFNGSWLISAVRRCP